MVAGSLRHTMEGFLPSCLVRVCCVQAPHFCLPPVWSVFRSRPLRLLMLTQHPLSERLLCIHSDKVSMGTAIQLLNLNDFATYSAADSKSQLDDR